MLVFFILNNDAPIFLVAHPAGWAAFQLTFQLSIIIMTYRELSKRISVTPCNKRGVYRVWIRYRGYAYQCYSTNSMAYDTIKSDGACYNYYRTQKQALQALYDECKAANNLK